MNKRTQSKVSMVVPVYNKIDDIDMMLESVYNQIWDNIELILVNDGATDGTRERLAEWEPRFKKRGYEAVIIDQENQGIPGAVKAGLSIVKGDYVCLADCDDVLNQNYVSAMAGWLDEHTEDEWVACTYNRIRANGNSFNIVSTKSITDIPSPPMMMEKYLSGSYATEVWIYMVRADYLLACKVVENYITDIRSTQEPSFLFPLIMGGGKLGMLDLPLYNYNISPNNRESATKSIHSAVEFQDKYRDMSVKAINNLTVDESLKRKWRVMAEFAHKRPLLKRFLQTESNNEQITNLVSETVILISKYFKPDPCITAEHIIDNGYSVLSAAIADCILGRKQSLKFEGTGRVIGCGALGKAAQQIIPAIAGTILEPTELWDNNANPGDTICDKQVTSPRYESLSPDDIVLIFPVDNTVKSELSEIVSKRGVSRILYRTDIRNILPEFEYPQFYSVYKFHI